MNSFIENIEQSIRSHWRMPAFTDYEQSTLRYRDVAVEIEKLHILFEQKGIEPGDKIAICSRNMSNWGVTFLATLTYGAVIVPILHEFSSEQINNILEHSEARMLFVGDQVWKRLGTEILPENLDVVLLNDYSLLVSKDEKVKTAIEQLNKLFGEKFPKEFTPDCISYKREEPETLAIINYTSGTTSNSKGVMIPYRAISGNMLCAEEIFVDHAQAGDNILSMLPLAHTFGMSFEFLYEFTIGVHIFFLTKMPSPTVLLKAMQDIKPIALVCVPLILEKVVRKAVLPKIQDPKVRLLLKTPFVGRKLKERIRTGIQQAFGGRFYEAVVGGAAMNQEIEALLHDIGFNFAIGYGATECAPLISFEDWHRFVPGSCGKLVKRMEISIKSRDPHNIPGEICVKGQNVMLGYFKNPEATAETLQNGWYHTGDLGIIDHDGNIFIKGRIKNLLLSSNGQNIYPEEIEDKLGFMPWVLENVVVQRDGKLYALVYPDLVKAKKEGVSMKQLEVIMENNRKELNSRLPSYQQISGIIIRDTEFEKTPKRSIKRYLYK